MTVAASRPRQASLLPLVIMYSGFVLLGLPDGMLGVAWPSMRTTFDVPLEAFGALLLPGMVGFMLTSLFSGRLITGWGLGTFLVVGAAIRTAGLLGIALAPGWAFLLAANLLVGIGSGVADAGYNTFVASHYSAGRLSWLHACFGLGATAGPLIMTRLLAMNASWQTGYLVAMGLQGVILLLLIVFYRLWWLPGNGATPDSPNIPAASPWATLRIPAVLLAIGVYFMYTGVEVTGGNLTYTLWTEGRGIDLAVAGTWISIYWGALTVGRIVSGIVVDRLGAVRLLRWSLLGVAIGAVLVAVREMPLVSFLGLTLVGFAEASIFPTMIAIVPERFGAAHAPNVIGFQIAAAGLGYALVPGLAGVLAARVGLEIVGPYLLLVGLIMWVLFEVGIRRTPVGAANHA
ncbi:MAG: MFS transporter [Anaerolineae bacterium]